MQPSKTKFSDPEHPDTTLTDWSAFQKGFSPHLIDTILDRRAAHLPVWFVPLARGAAIASSYLLRKAGYWPGMGLCPVARTTIEPDARHLEVDGDNRLVVRRCGCLWTVEWWNDDRRPFHKDADQVLVHSFGSTPILTRCCESASYLAVACMGGTGAGLRWINACPVDYQNAVKFAKKRRIDETRSQSNVAATKNKRTATPTTGTAQI
jgi:hypothetical protein